MVPAPASKGPLRLDNSFTHSSNYLCRMHSEPGPVVSTGCHVLGLEANDGKWNKQKLRLAGLQAMGFLGQALSSESGLQKARREGAVSLPPLPDQNLLISHTEAHIGGQNIPWTAFCPWSSLWATHRPGSCLIQRLLQGQVVMPGKAPASVVGKCF